MYVCDTILYTIQDSNMTRSTVHHHNTRNKDDIDLPYKRLKKTQDQPQYIGKKILQPPPPTH